MASRISNIPSLKSFMQQSQARALYRKALRISRPLDRMFLVHCLIQHQ